MLVEPDQGNAAHTHEVEEIFFVLKGCLTVFMEDEETGRRVDRELNAWECAACPPGVVHGYINNTNEPVNHTYYSGQSFDFMIRDGNGNEVYRWSHGRFFTLPVIFRPLQPGDALDFPMAIELRDNNGNALPAGNYTVEGIHKGGKESATCGFKIN